MKGLTSASAAEFLKQYGLNIIAGRKNRPIILKFFDQFNNFFTILLLFAALISILIGDLLDGILILTIVFLNAFFGFFQESKAEKSLLELKKITTTNVRVIRDGQQTEIDSKLLVPGDIIFIEEGSRVPADCIVLEGVNLEINEAAITGESLPVTKGQNDQIFMGTTVARGRAYARIEQTGMKTKFGQIASELDEVSKEKTPIQKKLEQLSRIVGVLGIAIAVLVFGLSKSFGASYFESFLLSVSLAVAVVPEGLPAVLTIALAVGVRRMARRKSIIRKLSAIEGLGSVTLIATDKTGTLTTNKMRVKEVFVDEKLYKDDKLPSQANHPYSKVILNSVVCSTASLVKVHDHGNFEVLGDPTEGALLYMAKSAGLIVEDVRASWKLIKEVPFDSITKIMSVTVVKDGETIEFTKGAPEAILERSKKILIGSKEERLTTSHIKKLEEQVDSWASKGLRVIAFSSGDVFLGMVAIYDPPRQEVKEAIKIAKSAGIKVVMITGDNEKTAEAIAVSTGLIVEGDEIMTGKQLDQYTDEQLLEHLKRVRVFARTTPFHKHRIVKLYQQLGEIVAVTGDGVNDAIALKQANIGIAMGIEGTDVARETADMVIADDNFASIITAIEEGRHIVRNLKNSIKYLLAGNAAEALSLIVAMFFGVPQLYLPIQLLYINLITDGIPALALAFSPYDENIMKNSPSKVLTLLNRFDKAYVFGAGIVVTGLVLASYFLFSTGGQIHGRTAAFSVLAITQSFMFIDLWLSHRPIWKSLAHFKKPIFWVAFSTSIVLQLIIIQTPIFARLFKTNTVSLGHFIQFIFFGILVIPLIEVFKRLLPKQRS